MSPSTVMLPTGEPLTVPFNWRCCIICCSSVSDKKIQCYVLYPSHLLCLLVSSQKMFEQVIDDAAVKPEIKDHNKSFTCSRALPFLLSLLGPVMPFLALHVWSCCHMARQSCNLCNLSAYLPPVLRFVVHQPLSPVAFCCTSIAPGIGTHSLLWSSVEHTRFASYLMISGWWRHYRRRLALLCRLAYIQKMMLYRALVSSWHLYCLSVHTLYCSRA